MMVVWFSEPQMNNIFFCRFFIFQRIHTSVKRELKEYYGLMKFTNSKKITQYSDKQILRVENRGVTISVTLISYFLYNTVTTVC
jgi:hypothetical protein